MVQERALKGAALRLITVVGLGGFVSGEEVFKLSRVARVEYRFEEVPPKWDSVPEDDRW